MTDARKDAAEALALHALGWMVGNAPVLEAFLGATGAAPDDLRARAADAGFLSSVLDFLLTDDAWVVAFCDDMGLRYEEPMQAAVVLGGARHRHWT
ncbi:DUF3572 domain-containing protein [Neotabrizicola shimadae]|uniref:DUF3572 domain-containing protein n=1 Tax=Neotabrizicola shimadae TaxID=2807096 RepID=A0A8G0ZR19_9RHOB|nr:DUF3572 domain-containing protein [Neotabrizicola shimadae]QYZ68523.1 DUF3572 domain-containing protein [Neotabrizicola shimadae]